MIFISDTYFKPFLHSLIYGKPLVSGRVTKKDFFVFKPIFSCEL